MKEEQKKQVDIKYLQTPSKQINMTFLKKCLQQNKTIPSDFVKDLIYRFQKIIQNQPNILHKPQPVTIIGDIHGQFRDLLKILSLCPTPSSSHTLVFLGDYVDRGPFGTQVMILLMAMKITYPTSLIMLRGNHQSRQMTQCFNFYSQICEKYNQQIYYQMMDMFDFLPLVCIIDKKYFCVHGGISPKALDLDTIKKEKRNIQIPLEGVVCDLIWSDPTENTNGAVGLSSSLVSSSSSTILPYQQNNLRNCSILYGKQLGHMFLKKNNLLTIIRAHQVQMQGFKQHIWPGWGNIPTVYTIFSAPNYCGTYRNKGAILTINEDFKIRQYKQEDPKYFLPEKFDAFNLSAYRIFDIVDKFCKRLTKAKTKQIPEVKQLSSEQILAVLLQYAKDTNVKSQPFPIKSIKINNNSKNQDKSFSQISKFSDQNNNQSSIFSKIKDYYKNSQKRSHQGKIKIAKNKVQQIK